MRPQMQRAFGGFCLLLGAAVSGCSSDAAPEGQGAAGAGNTMPSAGMNAGGSVSNAGTGGGVTAGSPQGGNPASSGGAGSGGMPSAMAGSGGAAGGASGSATGGASGGGGGGPAGDTWESYAKGFMETYCVSCHNDDNAGSAARNYHMLDAVKGESEDIACGLAKSQEVWSARGCSGGPAARQFPAGGGAKPEDANRDRILAWIDAGMP